MGEEASRASDPGRDESGNEPTTADGPASESGPAPASGGELDFQTVYREHVAFVWRTAAGLGVPREELEDFAQDVFLVVHRKLPEFEGRSSVRTWIYSVLRRTLMARRRRVAKKRTEPLAAEPADDAARTPEQVASRRQAQAALQQILAKLSHPQREVFVMVDIQHMSPQEAAEILGISTNTVYSRLRAARSNVERQAQRLANREEWRRP